MAERETGGPFQDLPLTMSALTPRDHFAGQALALGGEWFEKVIGGRQLIPTEDRIAAVAYRVADAMLAVRSAERSGAGE